MKKIQTVTKAISIILLTYLLTDLVIFKINTMPVLTQIRHDDFIKEADGIKDLSTAKIELKKWIDKRYNSNYLQNESNIKYIYIIIIILLMNVFDVFYRFKQKKNI
ncbi:hypothetical protein [Chryseobacterium arthrosphaerae]|uniref:hypothetical protein n=1 Tax=Chryseobacterium arthrosphaerae TaxID=651561 RepID=UPI001F4BB0A5|nr:hypothetical protein [Chryseobacterium arthrosphaerae]